MRVMEHLRRTFLTHIRYLMHAITKWNEFLFILNHNGYWPLLYEDVPHVALCKLDMRVYKRLRAHSPTDEGFYMRTSCCPHIANWIGMRVYRRPKAHSPTPTKPPTNEVDEGFPSCCPHNCKLHLYEKVLQNMHMTHAIFRLLRCPRAFVFSARVAALAVSSATPS